eukprot:3092154-Alexandrium_andersonii.AAC.1
MGSDSFCGARPADSAAFVRAGPESDGDGDACFFLLFRCSEGGGVPGGVLKFFCRAGSGGVPGWGSWK